MSQRGLAKAAGLTPSHVGLIESGRSQSPEATTVSKLAKALRVPYAWLSDGEGSHEPGDRPVRYENCEAAIAFMGSKWSDGAVGELRSFAGLSPTDFAVDLWIGMGNTIERARATGQKIGRPLEDEDDTPPAGRK